MILYGNWFEKHANKRTTTVLNTAHLLMGDELNSDECQDIHQREREPEFAHVQNTSFKQCCNFGGLMIRGLSALNEERHWTEGSMSTCRLKHLAGWWRWCMMKRPGLGQSISVWSPDILVSVTRLPGYIRVFVMPNLDVIWCDMIQ